MNAIIFTSQKFMLILANEKRERKFIEVLKRIINTVLWTVVALYLVAVALFHVPVVQHAIGSEVARVLSAKLGTAVSVGRVDLGFANRLIVDDIHLADQKGQPMLRAARVSAKVELLPLMRGRIVVTSSQFFGLRLNLYKENAATPANFQFVVDSLSSKEPKTESSAIDLQIGALVIRHGQVSYRRMDKAPTDGRFSANDLDVKNISAHFILNRLTNDSINVKVKRLSFDEKSGFRLKNLAFQLMANSRHAALTGFQADLPHSSVRLADCEASYRLADGKPDMASLQFSGGIADCSIRLSDLACFLPKLKQMSQTLRLSAALRGRKSTVEVESLRLSDAQNMFNLFSKVAVYDAYSATLRSVKLPVIQLQVKQPFIEAVAADFGTELPAIVSRLGDVALQGELTASSRSLQASCQLKTGAGEVQLALQKNQGGTYKGKLATADFNLQQLTDNPQLGTVSADATIEGKDLNHFLASATIAHLQFKAYDYRDISLEAKREGGSCEGEASIHDPNLDAVVLANLLQGKAAPTLSVQANVQDCSPAQLHLSEKWGNSRFALDVLADIQGHNIHDAVGTLQVSNFSKTQSDGQSYELASLALTSERVPQGRRLTLDSDFGNAEITGNFDYASLPGSFFSLVGNVLPTLPGLPKVLKKTNNDFTLSAYLTDTEWLQQLLGVPLDARRPLRLAASLDDRSSDMSLSVDAPSFLYAGKPYRQTSLQVSTTDEAIRVLAHTEKIMDNGRPFSWNADVSAHHDRMTASVRFDNHERNPFRGSVNLDTQLHKDEGGASTAYVDVKESEVTVGDATWHVRPASIVYKKNDLSISGFTFESADQHIAISGRASNRMADSLYVDLKSVDVSYILNLVNFHSVDFSGFASGRAHVAGLFTDRPEAKADLSIADFRFENGRMGTLLAHADYDSEEGQINIDAVAADEGDRRTFVRGYVSPKRSCLDLAIDAQNTRLEFMESFCSSFLENVEATAAGKLRLYGPLSNINLTGELVANGSVGISSLSTNYVFRNDTVRLVPDEIQFRRDTIYDRNGNIGILSGNLYHQHLTNLSYDLSVKAQNLLSYDTHSFGENTFYGTVYATGDCRIVGRSGEVNFDINATPNKGTIITYLVDSRTELSSSDFLTWRSPKSNDSLAIVTDSLDHTLSAEALQTEEKPANSYATDIRMNFLVNCTPDATIKLIMDERSGDYIAQNGDGVMRATYYNKGSFDLYGNYIVADGVYKLTIQDVIRKDFTFQQGGVLAFGGDPFDANISLKALYVLNGVSLSDLNIGRSFNNNNVRVDCLMNITGTANAPKVDFSLDMPTLGNDVKQMVRSIINAEEEMNQQVLYLLAVGRFYNRGNNNAASSTTQDSQTSLAMQSFLSGTISQQINQVLGSVVNSSNWNFGANISTGSEGFYNAEYEGLLSGRLFNNRLIFNGQFGYRDNANATTSFIGDFDLRYLLYPNGNLSINVYNKANDRYFTRNSLNTQGIGIIVKKDFNGLRDLLNIRKKKSAEAAE